jgi:hypothetical protein
MSHKDITTHLRRARAQGFDISQDGRSHYKVTNPETHESVRISSTPGSPAGVRTALAQMARIGYVKYGKLRSGRSLKVLLDH